MGSSWHEGGDSGGRMESIQKSVSLMVGIRPGLFVFCTRKGLGRVGVKGVCILGGQSVINVRTMAQHGGK
jgi:hypothetical protein